MSVVELDARSLHLVEERRCHLLPCNIEYDGEANVSTYFEPAIRQTKHEGLTCSLRGRPLNGKIISLPAGYRGIVIKEKPVIEGGGRKFDVVTHFANFTYWNLDKVPSVDDKISKALCWIDIAKALHSSNVEESQSSDDKMKH